MENHWRAVFFIRGFCRGIFMRSTRLQLCIQCIYCIYMATKTAVLNVRTDAATKRAAQRAARMIGVPLSTIINARLREFVAHPRVELVPNARTRRAIDAARKEMRDGKGESFDSVEKLLADLHS